MAALNFPTNPTNGTLYPNPALPDIGQWVYNSATQVWSAVPFYVRIQANAYNTYSWPTTFGEATQVLTTDGNGTLQWGGITAQKTVFVTLELLEAFDGVNTSFTFVTPGTLTPYTPAPSSNLCVILGGVPQVPGTSYSVSTNTITFTEAPSSGASFFAFTMGVSNPSYTVSATLKLLNFAEAFDGTRVTFTLQDIVTSAPYVPSAGNLTIFLGGVPQVPVAAYSQTGGTVTFTEAPLSGATVYAISTQLASGSAAASVIKTLSLQGTFDGTIETFTLVDMATSMPFTVNPNYNIVTFLGGVPQEYGAAYTVSGDSITFTEAPFAGSTFFAISSYLP